jgi:outer membrane immunogenic protein
MALQFVSQAVRGATVMKKFLLATFAAALTAGAAQAADLPPVKAPAAVVVAPAPVYNWTGFYVGGALGYALWDADTALVSPVGTGGVVNNGGRGWVGQVVAGYDYQFAIANWGLVAGVFADYDFGNVQGSFSSNTSVAANNTTVVGIEKEKSFWSVGGRIGWLVTPQILSYWSGGYTQARFDGVSFAGTNAGLAAPMSMNSQTYHGWFLGGGVEAQSSFLPGLFFNTDYRFASYQRETLLLNNSTAALGFAGSLNIKPYEQTILSGIRYKFNWTH